MNIEHYVTFRYTPDKEKLLQRIQDIEIKYDKPALQNEFSPLLAFTILESDSFRFIDGHYQKRPILKQNFLNYLIFLYPLKKEG